MKVSTIFLDKNKIMAGKNALVFTLSILCLLAIMFKSFYELPLWESCSWFASVFICFFIPGSMFLKIIDYKENDFFIHTFLSLGLGVSIIPVVYLFARRYAHPEIFLVIIFVLMVLWCFFATKNGMSSNILKFDAKIYDAIIIVIIITLLLVILHLSHFTDIVIINNGFKIRDSYLTETIFHLGIINSLSGVFPPPSLYASGGADFSYYHLNMHLAIEMLNRFFSIRTLSLTYFYFPFLCFVLLAFLPYVFFSKFWRLNYLGAFCGLLMFGSDLSFVPALLKSTSTATPWTLFFPTTIWSLFTLNGILPALATFLLCVFFLQYYFEHNQKSTLVLLALLGYGAFGFKSSMGLQIMIVVFGVGLILWVHKKERQAGYGLCLTATFSLLLMLADIAIWHETSGNYNLSFDLFNQFKKSLHMIFSNNISTAMIPVLFFGYVIATFSVKISGIYLVKFIFDDGKVNITILFLLLYALTGFVVSEVTVLSNTASVNNSVWFTVQGLMGSWLLFGYMLKYINSNKLLILFILTAIILASPTTIQFLKLRYDKHYIAVDQYAMAVVNYLMKTEPDSVVLHLPNINGPSLASNLSGRPSVINTFRSFVGEKDNVTERLRDVSIFFSPSATTENRNLILKKYDVDYVYVPAMYHIVFMRQSSLIPVVQNESLILYKVNI